MRINFALFLLLISNFSFTQSLEMAYSGGVSYSMLKQSNKNQNLILNQQNKISIYPNFLSEISLGINFRKEKLCLGASFNNLVYSYKTKTVFTNPDFFSETLLTDDFNAVSNHAVSIVFGYNLFLTERIFLRPYLISSITLKKENIKSGSKESFLVPRLDSTISAANFEYTDNVTFNPSFLGGIGLKLIHHSKRNIFYSVGIKYIRGMNKEFNTLTTIQLDDDIYTSQRYMKSSLVSLDAGIGFRFFKKTKALTSP